MDIGKTLDLRGNIKSRPSMTALSPGSTARSSADRIGGAIRGRLIGITMALGG